MGSVTKTLVTLSIAIPVFNGEKNIGTTLESLLEKIPSDVEIVVSDNASTDQTIHILKVYQHDHPNFLKVFQNEENLGYDRNIDLLFERANGRYVWLLGCGEKIKEGAIENIISEIEREDFDVAVVNFDIFSESTGKLEKNLGFPSVETKRLYRADDFSTPRYCPAVSANVVRRSAWLTAAKTPLIESGWCHVERIFSIIGNSEFRCSLFVGQPCFTLFRDRDGWWTKPGSYLLLLRHINILRSLPDRGIGIDVASSLERKHSRWALLRALIQSKSYGLHLSAALLKKLVVLFWRAPFFWLLVLPCLFVPSFIFVQLRDGQDRFSRSRKS
jgi:glycosyltransferase involved in cell wall biosynthesis